MNKPTRAKALIAAGVAAILVSVTAVAVASAESPGSSCTGTAPDENGHITLDCVVPMPSAVTVTTPVPTTVTETVTSPPTTVTQTVPAPPTTTTPPPTTTPPTTPSPTQPAGCPVAGTHVPGGSDGRGGCWPGPGNTGVPAGTTLTAYSGPSTIRTAGTRLTGVRTGSLTIAAAGVVIDRSQINGTITVASGDVTVVDSQINAGSVDRSAVGDKDFKLLRVDVRGSNRGAWCVRCEIVDSWFHDRQITGSQHASGVRMDQDGVIRHSVLACDVRDNSQGGGCSADLTGYGDFQPVQRNLIENNLFIASTGYFCAYGGSSGGKPYSGQASDIRFVDNVFQRGPSGRCGGPRDGGPIVDFSPSRPGNVFTGNAFDDGTLIRA